MSDNKRILELALKGLEVERNRITEEIASIQKQLGGNRGVAAASAQPAAKTTKKRSRLSPAGRKALAESMKRRWAMYRKGKGSRPGAK
jgi:hypothetical protein